MAIKEIPEELEELKELARPLVEYLRKKHHPHTAILVTDQRAVLVEEVMGVPFDGYRELSISTEHFLRCVENPLEVIQKSFQIAIDGIAEAEKSASQLQSEPEADIAQD